MCGKHFLYRVQNMQSAHNAVNKNQWSNVHHMLLTMDIKRTTHMTCPKQGMVSHPSTTHTHKICQYANIKV